jgi:AsmA-like protein
MVRLRKSSKLALSLIILLVAAQVTLSVSVRTQRVHNYIVAHLETAFGRPVQAQQFDLELLPGPRIYATNVTVGEDPAFGYEYFLRAEHMTAGLRWSGLLRGHIEFGTLTLNHPSLTLVRNSEGRWNLEDWLPPAKKRGGVATEQAVYGPPASHSAAIAARLEKINFDDGRINFKSGEAKQAFALTTVNGSVEQISPGRWKLEIEAAPWRSGVALQSAGTVQVHGDIAGTSARLQPASLDVRWEKASLADLFRLLRGKDYGLRGSITLDATAKSGLPSGTEVAAEAADSALPGVWSFNLRAVASRIHRWDLTERSDNPSILTTVQGNWNVNLGTFRAGSVSVESALSNLRGTAEFGIASHPYAKASFDSVAVQASDILSWYRAFHGGVADGISADEFVRGSVAVHGFPFSVDALDLSSLGGVVTVRGLEHTLKIPALRAAMDRSGKLTMDPVRIAMVSAAPTSANVNASAASPTKSVRRRTGAADNDGEAAVTLTHDFVGRNGELTIQGRTEKAEAALKLASAFGYTLNHGWDLTGPARADLRRDWSASAAHSVWNGSLEVNGAQLAAAGLNQPVELQQARLEWHNGQRTALVGSAQGFGTTWSGAIAENPPVDSNAANPPGTQDPETPTWTSQLHADKLDAAELDRWAGPRARPGWLQRLLPSLLGGTAASDPNAPASELVRRLNVSGDLTVDEFTIEKLKLQQVRLHGSLHELQIEITDGRAQWAGGTVRASMLGKFSPRPAYEVRAEFDGVNVAQLPMDATVAGRLSGLAAGTVHLKTAGIGRDELLRELTGAGRVHLADLEVRGFDLNATAADGEAHPGLSHWNSGDGAFTIKSRSVALEDVRLDSSGQSTLVNGSVNFRREADLEIETGLGRRALRNASAPAHLLKIVGPLDDPRLSREEVTPRQPAD